MVMMTTSDSNIERQSRRQFVRYPITCRAQVKLSNQKLYSVIIQDYCSGGLLLVPENTQISKFDLIDNQIQSFELTLQEPGLPELTVLMQCARSEPTVIGARFLGDAEALIAALQSLEVSEQSDSAASPIDALKVATTVVVCDRLANRVVACLDPAMTKFFKAIVDIKHDPEVLLNIRGAVAVNEVLDFLKAQTDIFITQRVDEVRAFFKALSVHTSVQSANKQASLSNSSEEGGSFQKLALVDKDDFEEWLSAKLVANKTDTEIKNEWQLFLVRLSVWVGKTVEAKSVPFAPLVLCDCLRDQIAVSSARPPRNVVSKVYAQYYQQVLSNLLGLVKQLNRDLEAAGCLPGEEVYKHMAAQVVLSSQRTVPKNSVAKNAEFKNSDQKATPLTTAKPPYSGLASATILSESTQQAGVAASLSGSAQTPGVVASLTEIPASSTTSLSAQLPPVVTPLEENLTSVNELVAAGSVSMDRPEQNLVSFPVSKSLSHARFLSGKAMQAVSHLLSMQKALQLPADYTHQRQDSLDVSATDLLTIIKSLQLETYNQPLCLQDGLRVALERHLKGKYHFTLAQLLSLSVVERIFSVFQANAELDPSFHSLLKPLSLLVFKALLLDDALLRNDQHVVRQFLNGIAYLGCRAGGHARVIQHVLFQIVQALLQKLDSNLQVFSEYQKQIEEKIVFLRAAYQRNLQRIQERFNGAYKIEHAKKMTVAAIDKCLMGKYIAPDLLAILDAGFRESLYLAYVKQGEQSKFWKIGLLALDELAVITSNHNANWDFLKLKPSNLFKIVQTAFSHFPEKRQEQMVLLQNLQRIFAEKKALGLESLVLYPAKTPIEKKIRAHGFENNKWFERTKAIKIGDSLQMRNPDKSEVLLTCAWIAPDHSQYVLVNHLGVLVGEFNFKQMVERFVKRQWRLASSEDLPVFDQGLDLLIEKVYTELSQDNYRDELTGLLNSKGFEKELALCLRNIQENTAEYVLAYFSLDQFRTITAAGGYEVGDNFLKAMASQIFSIKDEHTLVARLSGDEFCVLLKYAEEYVAMLAVEQLSEAIQNFKFVWENTTYQLSASFGVVSLHAGYLDVRAVLKDCQSAVSMAQKKGHACIYLFSDHKKSPAKIDHAALWINKIDNALEHDLFKLRIHKIEPINPDLADNKKPHYEVLLSIVQGDELLPPYDFICAAERYQKMVQVDCWVIKKVFEWLIDNQHKQSEIGMLSINLSGYSLNDGQIIKYIFEAFASSKVPCDKICFEITETVALDDLTDIVDFMSELKSLGCFFALDDFGTGSASYQYLKHLPVDFIKIDGSFVRDMTNSRHDWAMVKSITDMGHLMGKQVIAEYVEDQQTLDQLKSIGVDYAQGFHIEKPKWLS